MVWRRRVRKLSLRPNRAQWVLAVLDSGDRMTLLLAITLPAIIAGVFLGAAYVWRNEVNAVLRSIERY